MTLAWGLGNCCTMHLSLPLAAQYITQGEPEQAYKIPEVAYIIYNIYIYTNKRLFVRGLACMAMTNAHAQTYHIFDRDW